MGTKGVLRTVTGEPGTASKMKPLGTAARTVRALSQRAELHSIPPTPPNPQEQANRDSGRGTRDSGMGEPRPADEPPGPPAPRYPIPDTRFPPPASRPPLPDCRLPILSPASRVPRPASRVPSPESSPAPRLPLPFRLTAQSSKLKAIPPLFTGGAARHTMSVLRGAGWRRASDLVRSGGRLESRGV